MRMRIWFTEIGEPLPIEADVRLHRYGMLTRALASYGHDVVWWTSSFSHWAKRQICDRDSDFFVDGVKLRVLTGPGYRRNVSLQRIIHQRHFAKRFYQAARQCERPHLIISPVPTLEVAANAVSFAREYGIPILTDIRDEWPDEFVDLCPKPLKGLFRIFLCGYYKKIRDICRHADGILAMSRRQLDYGLKFAGRPEGINDALFPHGYSAQPVDPQKVATARQWWIDKGIKPEAFHCCFFGTIGNFFNLRTVIEAAKVLAKEFSIQFILCGSGGSLEYYRKLASDTEEVIFPGWVDAPKIAALMEMSHVGLAPYAACTRMSLPNKPFEYFAGGLPVVSSIEGELRELLVEYDCGRTYRTDSVTELCAVLRELKWSEPLRKAMGIRARRLLEEKFSIETISSDFNNHLIRVVKNSQSQI
jgi:glycosyltransferase involved in cell wall biosynthesis